MEDFDRGAACGHPVGAKSARPATRRMRAVAREADIGIDLALEKLAHQDQLAVVDAVRHHVAHRHAPSAVASLGRKSRTW